MDTEGEESKRSEETIEMVRCPCRLFPLFLSYCGHRSYPSLRCIYWFPFAEEHLVVFFSVLWSCFCCVVVLLAICIRAWFFAVFFCLCCLESVFAVP